MTNSRSYNDVIIVKQNYYLWLNLYIIIFKMPSLAIYYLNLILGTIFKYFIKNF